MGNLCSIFHVRFKNLIKVIPSARKAQLVDYILLGWQTSTYKLKNSQKKWFMKPYSQIVEDTGIPRSTLERYIKELHDEGFIERRQALYSRTKEQGEFEVKKGAYIYITEKLLTLLKSSEDVSKTPPGATTNTHNNESVSWQDRNENRDYLKTDCNKSSQNEGIDPLILRGLNIRDLYEHKNNIIFEKLTCSVDKETVHRLNQQIESIKNLLYYDIKEEIPNEIKNLILGTFFNLTYKHLKQFSSPKQVVAEYLFALLNRDFYLPQIECFKHRNNILSKMIRNNQWRTPKGFYKHFYLGQSFKDKQESFEQQWKQQKDKEINLNDGINNEKEERLILIESRMYEKSCLIDKLTQSIYQQSNQQVIIEIREQIKSIKNELEALWHQQTLIEQESEQQHLLNDIKHCA
ncbi:hypothetical protein [Legionella sp. PC997]|uniref:helix-turn-helix domain-containing protein n=1 Tax=Legionella sp. PC997 TaxID=2755562 RepID=UPI0015F8A36A|nr:hypothetical protein [Legionella sp. PC997]QMT62137.1 hypothetical protein HBNCFIEN_03545 [Legionella sp. PC997]